MIDASFFFFFFLANSIALKGDARSFLMFRILSVGSHYFINVI